jgi:hypothetical protein
VRDFAIAPTTGGCHGAAGLPFGGAALRHQSQAGALDLTVLAADGNASAAGIFTTNLAAGLRRSLSRGVISSAARASRVRLS